MSSKSLSLLGRWFVLLVVLGFVVGVAVRVVAFQNYLPGLNQDEASSGYEAWSLWHTGWDRWGEVRWPVYFTAWGSGQNVLLSYLVAPLVGLFGMSSFTVRILPFALSLATLPLVFVLARCAAGAGAALVALWFLALSPWHTMMSAWALESNLLPFFLALTLLFLELWRARPQQRRWLGGAGLGAGLCLYSYGTALLVLPLLGLFYGISHLARVEIRSVWREGMRSVLALVPGFMLSLPFLLFTLKNYVVHDELGIEARLPFGLQLLSVTRLAQVEGQAQGGVLSYNFSYVAKAFDDGALWNTLPGHKPFLWVVLALALVQCAWLAVGLVGRRRQPWWPWLWCVAALPLFAAMPLNVNRANALWIPLLCLAAQGLVSVLRALRSLRLRVAVAALATLAVVGDYGWFYYDYVKLFPDMTRDYLRYHMSEALDEVEALRRASGVESVFVSPRAFWGYLYVAFHRQMDLEEFRATRETILYPYHADRLGDFFFHEAMLKKYAPEEYVFLFYKDERAPCRNPRSVREFRNWQLGVCRLRP